MSHLLHPGTGQEMGTRRAWSSTGCPAPRRTAGRWSGYRRLLGDAEGEGEITLGGSTHGLVVRFLSSLQLARRPRVVTTHGEFHSIRRQVARLAEVV